MYSPIITTTLFLSALRLASAESCAYGTYSCQTDSTARCVYTSGVAAAGGGYPTGWVKLESCSTGCEVVGGIAQCRAAGSTFVTKVATTIPQVAIPSQVSTYSSKGVIFAQTSTKVVVDSVTSTSKPSTAAAPTSTSKPSTSPSSSKVLLSSTAGQPVDATFYYDINGAGTCGAVNGIKSYAETGGYTYCEPSNAANAKTLAQRGTNNVVAMPQNIITGNASKYCGKKVVVTWNGVKRTDLDLFIWDSCAACSGNDGLDFSSTIFAELAGKDKCSAGRIPNEMSWEIVDESTLAYTP